MSGLFIVFDGMDGSGKSTALKALAQELNQSGHNVLQTREPGGSALAESIRECMLADWPQGMPWQTELLLVFAARAAHLQQTVAPALEQGKIVLCDRFVDSSYVYQGVLGGAPLDWIAQLAERTITCWPTQTFIFDLPVELALKRLQGRGAPDNRFDRESAARMEQVRAAFTQRVVTQPNSHRRVDAQQSAADVVAELRSAIGELL